ncbi:hypothetical protein PsYK624_137580 [Phanerochaete sordida]|uniref:Uncharacterized protein n=1 Tax=Phanerochaete sordida TaxID=48140 RepID=A0A9P3GL84_9APHY|nr:hypothetical protein PsYK624_137580 [Phanerochaete sordida]
MDIVRFCSLHIQLYVHYRQQSQSVTDAKEGNIGQPKVLDAKSWTDLWNEIGAALRKYWRSEVWTQTTNDAWLSKLTLLTAEELLVEDRALAAECLRTIDSMEHVATASRGSEDRDTVFPDTLVTALGLFVLPENVSAYPRLKRLREEEMNTGAQLGNGQAVDSDNSSVSSDDNGLPDEVRKALRKKLAGKGGSAVKIKVKRKTRKVGASSDSDYEESSASSVDEETTRAILEAITKKKRSKGTSKQDVKAKRKDKTRGRNGANSHDPTSLERSADALDPPATLALDDDLSIALRNSAFMETVRGVALKLGLVSAHNGRANHGGRKQAHARPSSTGTADALDAHLDEDLRNALRDPGFRLAVLEAASELPMQENGGIEKAGSGGESSE